MRPCTNVEYIYTLNAETLATKRDKKKYKTKKTVVEMEKSYDKKQEKKQLSYKEMKERKQNSTVMKRKERVKKIRK